MQVKKGAARKPTPESSQLRPCTEILLCLQSTPPAWFAGCEEERTVEHVNRFNLAMHGPGSLLKGYLSRF